MQINNGIHQASPGVEASDDASSQFRVLLLLWVGLIGVEFGILKVSSALRDEVALMYLGILRNSHNKCLG
jgi:hypothetical protein